MHTHTLTNTTKTTVIIVNQNISLYYEYGQIQLQICEKNTDGYGLRVVYLNLFLTRRTNNCFCAICRKNIATLAAKEISNRFGIGTRINTGKIHCIQCEPHKQSRTCNTKKRPMSETWPTIIKINTFIPTGM